MAFMQRAASLHAIPSQITIVVDDDGEVVSGGGNGGDSSSSSSYSMEAFFLFNANCVCTIAFYKNIMITSFYEWRDVSFLYGRLVCIGGALV